jgi:ferredoxin
VIRRRDRQPSVVEVDRGRDHGRSAGRGSVRQVLGSGIADKKKCISCNVCTSVCRQGIDIMNFANKGLPMADPQCVRCSACVQMCPTGVLAFARVNDRDETIAVDSLPASPVRIREAKAVAPSRDMASARVVR